MKKHGSADVRRWLLIATWEGALANVFITFTGGVFITGLALLLGANDFQIGLLAAIPFLAQVAQLASGHFVHLAKSRKRAVLYLSAAARQLLWVIPIVLLFNSTGNLTILMAVAILSNVGIMAATPTWMAWMADIVPGKVRGRYFGTRSAALAVVTAMAVLLGGVILDHMKALGNEAMGYVIIISISCIAAAVALFLLNKIPDPVKEEAPLRFSLASLKEPLRNPAFRRLLLVFAMWNIAIGISAPFFAPHMLTNLKMSFTLISIYSGVAATLAVVLNRPWGAIIDRFGSKPVIALCAFGIAGIPLLWLFLRQDFLSLLAFEAVYSGALWTGFNLAAFNIPIANSPRKNRPVYLSMFSVVTGLAFFSASVLGGALAEWWGDFSWNVGWQTFNNYHLIFFISAILRLFAARMSLTFHEPDERGVPVMMQFMGYAVFRRFAIGRQLFPWTHRRQN